MAEFPCPCCGLLLEGISTINLHFKITHPNYTVYSCTVGTCKRKFGSWDSFRKHLIRFHNLPLHAKSTSEVNSTVQSNNNVNEPADQNTENFVGSGIAAGDWEQPILTSDDFENLLYGQVDVLIAKLYSNPGFPRNLVDSMITDIVGFLQGDYFKIQKDFCFELLDKETPDHIRRRLSQMFEKLSNPFSLVSTEYKRLKRFESLGNYIPPKSYTIDSRMEWVSDKEGSRHEMRDVKGQFIPLGKVLTKFFEMPDVFAETVANMLQFESDTSNFRNFTQCEIWKRKRSKYRPDDFVFPLFLFYDDFEPNNALGPHCESLGTCYVCQPCLPDYCRSKVENLILALIFNADDRKSYGNYKTFRSLIEELKLLETKGIQINLSDGPKLIYFLTGVLMGDNKGLHEICGFCEGFNARYPCRMCKASKGETETMVVEDPSLIRTRENYAQDVDADDFGTTGIKEKCVFTNIPSVEMPSDMAVDIFHDGNEGVCHYTMIAVLKHFQSLDRSFIEKLNNRMYIFDFGRDSDNKPPSISDDRLSSNKLKMTGAEMFTFVKLFGVFVGDLVDEEDEFWQMYVLLHDIMMVTLSKELPRSICIALPVKVRDHHELYLKLTKDSLKPKHHHLLHYARIIQDMGPVALYSTIRCEAKHKSLKYTANVCSSRVNLPLTVAIKQQLGLCYRFTSKKSKTSSKLSVGPGNVVNLRTLQVYPFLEPFLPSEILNDLEQFIPKWVDYKGSQYKPEMVLSIGTDSESEMPLFGKIDFILICKDKPHFVCSPLDTFGFHSHVRGFQVEENINSLEVLYVVPDCLSDPLPLSLYKTKIGEKIIFPQYLMY